MNARGVDATAALADLELACAEASEAYRTFARIVSDEIAPRARPEVGLGEAEVAFRLRAVMGVETSLGELLAFGKAALARAHANLVERVQRSRHPEVRTAEQARDALMAVLAPKPKTIEEALALYRRHTDDAVRLLEERELVPLPKPLALTLTPVPGGIADGTTLTNWPARSSIHAGTATRSTRPIRAATRSCRCATSPCTRASPVTTCRASYGSAASGRRCASSGSATRSRGRVPISAR